MNTNLNRILTPTAAAASLLMLGSCGGDDKEEPSIADNSDFLIGEWELVSVDGEDYSYYGIAFKFESGGDFSFCEDVVDKVNPSESYQDCYEGDWQWITKGEELSISYLGEVELQDGTTTLEETDINFMISKLTATELEGSWKEAGETERYEVVMKKN